MTASAPSILLFGTPRSRVKPIGGVFGSDPNASRHALHLKLACAGDRQTGRILGDSGAARDVGRYYYSVVKEPLKAAYRWERDCRRPISTASRRSSGRRNPAPSMHATE